MHRVCVQFIHPSTHPAIVPSIIQLSPIYLTITFTIDACVLARARIRTKCTTSYWRQNARKHAGRILSATMRARWRIVPVHANALCVSVIKPHHRPPPSLLPTTRVCCDLFVMKRCLLLVSGPPKTTKQPHPPRRRATPLLSISAHGCRTVGTMHCRVGFSNCNHATCAAIDTCPNCAGMRSRTRVRSRVWRVARRSCAVACC